MVRALWNIRGCGCYPPGRECQNKRGCFGTLWSAEGSASDHGGAGQPQQRRVAGKRPPDAGVAIGARATERVWTGARDEVQPGQVQVAAEGAAHTPPPFRGNRGGGG